MCGRGVCVGGSRLEERSWSQEKTGHTRRAPSSVQSKSRAAGSSHVPLQSLLISSASDAKVNSGGERERKWRRRRRRREKKTPQSIFCHPRLQLKHALTTPLHPSSLPPSFVTDEAQQGRDDDNEDDNDDDSDADVTVSRFPVLFWKVYSDILLTAPCFPPLFCHLIIYTCFWMIDLTFASPPWCVNNLPLSVLDCCFF